MSAQFWPCLACSCHVKRGDAICPFCGASVSVDIPPTRVLAGRLSRAALFAAGAMGAVVASTDCNSAPPIPTPTTGMGIPAYGGVSAPICVAPCETVPVETEDSGTSDSALVIEIEGTSEDSSTSIEDATITDAADASTDATPTDSSSAADVPMPIVFYGAAIIVDE